MGAALPGGLCAARVLQLRPSSLTFPQGEAMLMGTLVIRSPVPWVGPTELAILMDKGPMQKRVDAQDLAKCWSDPCPQLKEALEAGFPVT